MTKINRSKALATVAAMALALCLLALVAIQPAEAAFPGMNGKIAFVSNRDVGAGEIYTISPTGGTATRIAFTNFSKDPAWSSDGSRIAFASTDNEIFVMKADGSGRRQITNTPTAKQEPAWSPDGTQIAYVANSFDVDQQTDFEIWVINADGSGRRQITNNSIPDAQPAWSPDGSKIAFVSSRTGDSNRNIYVMNSDGSGTAANLTPNTTDPVYQGHDDGPSWSPDGSKIVYTNATSDADVWTMNAADGSGKIADGLDKVVEGQTAVDKGLGDVREQAIEVLRSQFAQGTTLARQQLAGLDASSALIAETPGAANTTWVLTQSTSDIGFSNASSSSGTGDLGRNVALAAGGALLLMAGVAGGFLSGRRNAVAAAHAGSPTE